MLHKGRGCRGSWFTSWAQQRSLLFITEVGIHMPVWAWESSSLVSESTVCFFEAVEHRITSVLSYLWRNWLALYNTRIFLPQALEANAQESHHPLCKLLALGQNLKPCYACFWICSQEGLKESRARLFTVVSGGRMRGCEHELGHRRLPRSSGNTSSLCGLLSTGTGCPGRLWSLCPWR